MENPIKMSFSAFLDLSCYSAVGSDICPEPTCLLSIAWTTWNLQAAGECVFHDIQLLRPKQVPTHFFQDQLAHQAKLQRQSGGPGLLIYNPNLFVPWPWFWPYLTWISLTSHPTTKEKNRLKDSPFLLAEIVAAMAYPKVSAGSKSLGSSSDSSTSRGAGWKEAGPCSKTSRDESLHRLHRFSIVSTEVVASWS